MRWVFPALLFAALAGLSPGMAAQPQDPPKNHVVRTATETVKPERSPREMQELRADLMMIRKQYADAVQAYLEILRAEPRNAVLLNKIGVAYSQQSDLSMAKRYYERAIKADKSYAEAYNNLGTVHYQRKSYGKAIKSYRKALDLFERIQQPRPGYAAVHSNMGYALFARKKYENAMQYFQRALQLDPEVLDRRSTGGTLVQDRTVEERAFFYFFIAKNFALQGNAERCAHYLRRALDDGYRHFDKIEKDPAFSTVIQDPQVQEVLQRHAALTAPKSNSN